MWVTAGSLVPTLVVAGRIWHSGAWDYLVQHNFVGAWALVQEAPYAVFRSFTLRAAWTRDGGFVLLSSLAVLTAWKGPHDRRHGFVLATALWMMVTLLLTPGPFPYYLLSVFPLFAVLVPHSQRQVLLAGSCRY